MDLAAIGAEGDVDWLINDRLIGRSRQGAPLRHRFDEAGEQVIVAMDRSGQFDRANIVVMAAGKGQLQ